MLARHDEINKRSNEGAKKWVKSIFVCKLLILYKMIMLRPAMIVDLMRYPLV